MSTSCRNTPFPSLLSLPPSLYKSPAFILPYKFKSLKLAQVPLSLLAMNPNGKGPRLELKLNLSPPRAKRTRMELPNRSGSSSSSTSPTSPPSSCLSSEVNSVESDQTLRYSNSPEATSMVLVGCPRCLMYVMLSDDDPRCPKCKSTVLLDFINENGKNKNNNNNINKKYRGNNNH